MKKNRHLIRTLPMGALLLIAFVVLTAVNYPHRAKLIKHHTHHTPISDQEDLAPITSSELISLSDESESAYWIQDAAGVFAKPLMVNPMVNIQDIYNYYNNNEGGGKYLGIRFYPAYRNNSVFLIMCMAEGAESDLAKVGETKYISLDKVLLNAKGTIPSTSNEITATEAKALHDDYMQRVFLYKNVQNMQTTKDSLRYSRYYAWDDFRKLTDQNLPTGANKADYLFQIEIGYVSASMAAILYTRSNVAYTKEQNQGFTAMIHVKDKNGNSLLDPFSRYNDADPAEKSNYLGRTMEVGSPCPPRCGVNHQ